MLERLLKLLKNNGESNSEPRLEVVLQDLETAIASVKEQSQKIAHQESELLTKLQDYSQQHQGKIECAKAALKSGDELNAENLYKESEILYSQIVQYKRVIKDLQQTRQKLLSQENHFHLTKDQLKAKKSLGEANVDASQLKADLSEQLMILDESDELSKFDELILEATSKSEAIEEIRGGEDSIDAYMEASQQASIETLEELINEEKTQKLRASQQNQQVLIEQVFGKLTPSEDPDLKEKKRTLLEKLKYHTNTDDVREQTVSDFFSGQDQKPDSTDQEDRIKNFFEKEDNQAKESRKQAAINQFFNRKP
ncbi:MAG: hypothetical protein AAFQ94_22030 [Bacteroidota bacterium]